MAVLPPAQPQFISSFSSDIFTQPDAGVDPVLCVLYTSGSTGTADDGSMSPSTPVLKSADKCCCRKLVCRCVVRNVAYRRRPNGLKVKRATCDMAAGSGEGPQQPLRKFQMSPQKDKFGLCYSALSFVVAGCCQHQFRNLMWLCHIFHFMVQKSALNRCQPHSNELFSEGSKWKLSLSRFE